MLHFSSPSFSKCSSTGHWDNKCFWRQQEGQMCLAKANVKHWHFLSKTENSLTNTNAVLCVLPLYFVERCIKATPALCSGVAVCTQVRSSCRDMRRGCQGIGKPFVVGLDLWLRSPLRPVAHGSFHTHLCQVEGLGHRVIQGELCLDFAICVFLGKYGLVNARGSDFSLPLISGKYALLVPSSGTVVCKQHGPEGMGQPVWLEGSPAAGGHPVRRSGIAPATGSMTWEHKGSSTQSQKGGSACQRSEHPVGWSH